MMHYQYPIEQVASCLQTQSQQRFAREAAQLLPRRDDILYETCPQGLKLLAGDECALATPVEILQQVFGSAVSITAPRVRLQRDAEGLKEPVMNVRVNVLARHAGHLLEDLSQRGALLQEVDEQQQRSVIRAQARLCRLLGYRHALGALTDDTVALWMWLSHYAAVAGRD